MGARAPLGKRGLHAGRWAWEDHAAMEARISEEIVTDTVLTPTELWAIVSDTDRVNREAGLAPLALSPVAGRGAVRFVAETVIGPFRVAFEELPFEWTAPERLVIRRRMTRGPARELVVRFEVTGRKGVGERGGPGSRVTTRIEVELVGRRWKPAGVMVARWVAQRLDRAIRTLADAASRGAGVSTTEPSSGPRNGGPALGAPGMLRSASALAEPDRTAPAQAPSAPRRPLATREGWAARIEEGTELPWAPALVRHVYDAPDHQLVRIRPYELARDWGGEPRAVLETCLAATVSGLLELSWDLVCPSCRTAAVRGSSLETLGESAHCESCDLTFGLELDRAVEATFKPASAVRVIDDVRFCSGGPAMTPHVIAQRVIEPGGGALFEVPVTGARMRLFARGGAAARVELVEGAPARVVVRAGLTILTPSTIEVAPGGTLEVRLEDGEARHVKLERLEWASTAATAHDVSLIPRFRERFSGEVLKPGLALAVARVALVFSDLGASTALYTARGDAVAFRLVQDHFELLEAVIEKHGGTLVKTIGDAVMAAFAEEKSALMAALEMSAAFPAFRAARPHASEVSLKIGLFAGPCYVVEANGILDYFGQTVNVAARLQGQARDDEVVVTAEQWAEAEEWADAEVVGRTAARLKGITETVEIVHLARRSTVGARVE